ncbi:MAG: serine/threonine-protein kinase [Polyangiaceae bacterium]
MDVAGVKIGDLLLGKYRVERVLGSGGMGVVVAARHEHLEQLVAIKFIRSEALAHPDAALRFLREARAAAKLKSEHVAKVMDVGELESGTPYMVMEFLEGSDLAKILAETGPMPVPYALRLLRQACMALAEAHAVGIVHRDLKPQNLFLTHSPGGEPLLKVLDFGISKSIAAEGEGARALTGTAVVLGSPLYMAPEQMLSPREVDARVDVWSLGVVLFELLTGRWPFEADTYPALCVKIAREVPFRVSDLRKDVPSEVIAIIDRCLEKEVAKRFANAAELVAMLDALASDLFSAPQDARSRTPGRPPTASNPSDAFPKLQSTPAGWVSQRDGGVVKRRLVALGGLLLVAVATSAAFVVFRRSAPRLDSEPHALPAVQVPSDIAAGPVAEPRTLPSVAVPSPPVVTRIAPTFLSDPPSPASPAPPATATAQAPPHRPDLDGITLRRSSAPERSAAVAPAASRAPAAITAPTTANGGVDVDGIPSRR